MELSTTPRVHGGFSEPLAILSGVDPAQIADFSVNCNPYGPCPEVLDAVRSAPIERYPDPTAWRARECIARLLERKVQEIALGNGACELLWTLARVLVRPGTKLMVIEPTFSEFRAAAEHGGADLKEWR